MQYLDLTLPTPEQNLALEEALLDACEAGRSPGCLRVWEPQQYFVVVGYSNRVATEAALAACAEDNVPILRRCTGGGTVLQGPGCFNYALTLPIDLTPELATIHSTNHYVLKRNAEVIAGLIGTAVKQEGHTDLAVSGAKLSGNAQRRRQHALLFHGSFLLSMDIEKIHRYLPTPSNEPEYRQKRSHRDFVMNLGLPPEALKQALRAAWNANVEYQQINQEAVSQLVQARYSRREWNFKF